MNSASASTQSPLPTSASAAVAAAPMRGEHGEQRLLVAREIGERAEHRRQHGDEHERDRRGDAEAERGRRPGRAPLGRDARVVDRKHRRDDRRHERGVGPVVHRPRAQLGAVQAEAIGAVTMFGARAVHGCTACIECGRCDQIRLARATHSRMQRIDDDVAAVRLAGDQILAQQRGEAGLHARGAAEPMPGAGLGARASRGPARARRRAAWRAAPA